MVSKYTTKVKQFIRLGIRKDETGDYVYIDPSEKNRSKYESTKKYEKR